MPSETGRKPNIIFVLSDQHNPLVCGYAGDPHIRTPHLDQLAANGTRLANCYTGSPLCVPARMAMLTGLLPTNTRVFNNGQSLHSDIPTMAHSLTLAGYQTVLCGRMHFLGPDQRHGFQERLVGDFTHSRHGIPNPSMEGDLRATPGQSRTVIQKSGAGNTNVMEYDKAVIAAARARIAQSATEEQPLFMVIGLYGPHCPFICPRDLFDRYMDILPPPSVPEHFVETVHPAVHDWFSRRNMLTWQQGAVRRSRAAYYGLVEIIDRHIGSVLETVRDTSGYDDSLFIYASDHGDMIGHNGLFWKSNFYEGSVRVPVVVAQPGRIARGRVITHPTSLMDIPSTLADFTAAPQLPETDGESWYDDLTGKAYTPRPRTVFSILAETKGGPPAMMVRKDRWKLIRYHGYDAVQLFDLETDPHEQHDLGTDPAYAHVRAELNGEADEVWDGEWINGVRQRAALHMHFMRDYNAVTRAPEDAEVWHGDLADNYLE